MAVTDLQPEAADLVVADIRAKGGQADAWPKVNVAERATVERAADEIATRLGPIDVWVNNAGVSRVIPFMGIFSIIWGCCGRSPTESQRGDPPENCADTFMECTDELWDTILRVNLAGTFIGCQAALRQMLPRQRGVILNMSSPSGKAGNSQYAAYCASKFGIIGLTQSLAMEFARDGIRVNVLCPGVVWTALWDEQHVGDYGRKRSMKPDEVRPYLESKVPLGRLCTPEDVAGAAVFLASDAAGYITGQAINISGGSVMH